MMKKYIFLMLLITSAVILFGDYALPVNPSFFNPNFQLGSLLNPNNLKMSHTMSFASGINSSGNGFYQSAYTNHLLFNIKDNLKFNVDLSLVNQGSMTHQNNLNFKSNDDNNSLVIPAFSMEYQPFENTRIYINYQQSSGIPFNTQKKHDLWR
jgi:hypothetical protein